MASITASSISYSDLQEKIDETSLSNMLLDITGVETDEERANDFIQTAFYKLKAYAIRAGVDISDFNNDNGESDLIKEAFCYLALSLIKDNALNGAGEDFKDKALDILSSLWGREVYSSKNQTENQFDVSHTAYVATGKMKDLYDNDLFN